MPTITDEGLMFILAGLEGVTPGPWIFAEENYGLMSDQGYGLLHGYAKPGSGGWEENLFVSVGCSTNVESKLGIGAGEANAAHIARCDPDTIRSIVTELLAARKALR